MLRFARVWSHISLSSSRRLLLGSSQIHRCHIFCCQCATPIPLQVVPKRTIRHPHQSTRDRWGLVSRVLRMSSLYTVIGTELLGSWSFVEPANVSQCPNISIIRSTRLMPKPETRRNPFAFLFTGNVQLLEILRSSGHTGTCIKCQVSDYSRS